MRGLSENTCRAYLAAVKGLAAYYRRPPDQLTDAEVRQYQLHLIQHCQYLREEIVQCRAALTAKVTERVAVHRHPTAQPLVGAVLLAESVQLTR